MKLDEPIFKDQALRFLNEVVSLVTRNQTDKAIALIDKVKLQRTYGSWLLKETFYEDISEIVNPVLANFGTTKEILSLIVAHKITWENIEIVEVVPSDQI